MAVEIPTLGRILWYIDRDELVSAVEQQEPGGATPMTAVVTPFAGIVSKIHYTPRGVATERIDLAVCDPELGYRIVRDVLPLSEDRPGPGWKWPDIVTPAQMKAAKAAEDKSAKDEAAAEKKETAEKKEAEKKAEQKAEQKAEHDRR
jgi:hypothetical protein